jgi:hypothetical protein
MCGPISPEVCLTGDIALDYLDAPSIAIARQRIIERSQSDKMARWRLEVVSTPPASG